MNGVIIIPKYLEKHWQPKLSKGKEDFSKISSVTAPLWYTIRDELNFTLKYADEVRVSTDTDVVIVFGVPYHNRPKMVPGLLDLDKKIKLVMYPGDLQCYGNSQCLENKVKAFNRADLIISGGHEYFVKMYPQFLDKYEFLPLFYGPHKRYIDLTFNTEPKMKCLLSGATKDTIYPIRHLVKSGGMSEVVYRNSNYALGDAYPKLINSYFCCMTSSSIFNFAVGKYFEIPAAGSLLIANETNDLNRVGFIPNQHYVSITKTNAIETIKRCVNNPAAYNEIRKNGMDYVRKNHSVVNRVEKLKELFKEI